MPVSSKLDIFRRTDSDSTNGLRGLIRVGRRLVKRCWYDQQTINQVRVFCQNSGACGSTYIVKLLNTNGIERSFHEKTPDLLDIGLANYESPIANSQLIRLLRYTRHDVFFEANNRLFSLSLPLARAFPNASFIHLYRHPAEAVCSAMSKPNVDRYLKKNKRFHGTLAGPHDAEPFERFCHHWANMNRRIQADLLQVASQTDRRVVSLQFEDLIAGRIQPLEDILHRSLDHSQCQPANTGLIRSAGRFHAYKQWTAKQKRTFAAICEPVLDSIATPSN